MNANASPIGTTIKLSKLEAARRQLESAITLYFNGGDPVSTHTLATACLEILCDLNTFRKGSPLASDIDTIPPEHRQKVRVAFRKAQNFFKHADEDPNEVLDFNPESTTFFMVDAVEKFRELSGENPPVIRVFALWCRVHWSVVFRNIPKENEPYLKLLRSQFPMNDKPMFFAKFLPLYFAETAKHTAK